MGRTATALTLLTGLLLAAAPSNAGVIYLTAESSSSNFSHLYSYNTATAVKADLGVLQGRKYTTDLAADAAGNLYGLGWSNASARGTSHLFAITPDPSGSRADWSLQAVKGNDMDRTVNSAVFGDDDALYVASRDGMFQKLQRDGPGGQWDVVASANMGMPAGGDLAFSADGKDLYVALAGGKLGTVNFDADGGAFGRVSILGDTGYDHLYGLATVDGVLYGTTAGSGNYGDSSLIQIDPSTLATTTITNLGNGVWGAASVTSQAVPEPACLAFLVLGWIALSRRRPIRRVR